MTGGFPRVPVPPEVQVEVLVHARFGWIERELTPGEVDELLVDNARLILDTHRRDVNGLCVECAEVRCEPAELAAGYLRSVQVGAGGSPSPPIEGLH